MSARPPWIRSLGPLALTDLRHRYAGSVLGGFWAIVGPLLEVGAYAVVFGFLIPSASHGGGWSYAVFIASGILPWAALREALEACAGTLPDNRWIRRSRVPMELLVARHVVVAASRAIFALVLVLGASAAIHGPGTALVALPILLLAVAFQAALSYGLGLALAPLGTLHPDLRPGLASVLLLLTFASPILYPESALQPGMLALMEWNPFTHLLRLYRFPLGLPGGELTVANVAWPAVAAVLSFEIGVFLKDRFWWAARDAL